MLIVLQHTARSFLPALIAGFAAGTMAHAGAGSGGDCVITWAQALERGTANIVLADVRAADEYARFSIPGSVNLPLYTLLHKPFLKGQFVVVVGDAADWRQATRLCETAKDLPFAEFRVLEHGIAAVESVGNQGQAASLRPITAKDFITDSEYGAWLVIDFAGQQPSSQLESIGENHVWIAAAGRSPVAVANDVREQLREQPSLRVLVLQPDDQQTVPEALTRVAQGAGGVFYLQGGARALEHFLRQRTAMLAYQPTIRMTGSACEWVR